MNQSITKTSFITHCRSHNIKIFITSKTIGYIKNNVNHNSFKTGFTVEFKTQSISHHNKYIFQDSIQEGKTTIESGWLGVFKKYQIAKSILPFKMIEKIIFINLKL